MRTTIDRAGRLVIPKAIRDRVGLTDEGLVDIEEHDGSITIVPSAASVHVVETAEGAVIRAEDPDMPVLTAEAVRSVTESLRR